MKRYVLGILIAALVGGGAFVSGCGSYVETDPDPGIATNYYEPMYYQGYVVYYDNAGLPIYYVGGTRYYVPRTYVHYGLYTTHYRTYRVGYYRWNSHLGYRYRTVRYRPRYHGYIYHRRVIRHYRTRHPRRRVYRR